MPFPAKWQDTGRPGSVVRVNSYGHEYDALAGHFRNQQMIDEGKPDAAIIFPGGSGTADMANRIKKAGIPHWEITLP